jgi:hypothetical protein
MSADTVQDPKAATAYRVLLWVVIILGVLIVLAFGALIVGGVIKMGAHRGAALGEGNETPALLPPGAKVTMVQTSGNRLIIGVHSDNGDEVDVVDTDTGRLVARIRPAAHGLPK